MYKLGQEADILCNGWLHNIAFVWSKPDDMNMVANN